MKISKTGVVCVVFPNNSNEIESNNDAEAKMINPFKSNSEEAD